MTSGWYSLAGYLQMKFIGGAFTLLKPRRRYYFVLDEANCQLAYFKDETEFIKRKEPGGEIDIRNCAVSLSDSSSRAFTIHAVGGRTFELEADNDQSALVWLNCLQHRKDGNKQKQLNTFHNALDMGSMFSGSDNLSRATSSISLPSDGDMANMLDSAFHSMHGGQAIDNHDAVRGTPSAPAVPGQKNFKNQCTFYFSSTPPASDTVSTSGLDNGNPPDPEPSKKLEIPLSPSASFGEGKISRNAESLQHWIRNWLSDQETYQEAVAEEQNIDKASITKNFEIMMHNSKMEIRRLQDREHAYRRQIQDLNNRVKDLNSRLDIAQTCSNGNPSAMAKYLQNQNKFLNAEVIRLSSKWQDDKSQYFKFSKKVAELESELELFKHEYVYLLQSCIRVPLGERHSGDTMELKLFGGDVHKHRVNKLLEEARIIDPTLPTFPSLVGEGMSHVDVYGFKHSFAEESLALHYICTQLHLHYQSQLAAQQQHKHRWKLYLSRNKNILVNSRETRNLVRSGIPPSYRSAVWKALVHQQVVDIKLRFGKYYYRNLCSSHNLADAEYSSLHQKQITLDLLRTMPGNVHFSSPACKGVNQLQQVLRAFCLHNPTIGYCQGMNFVAGTCLLFLSPEDTFWFLVALTDRYFVSSYFDGNLTGAQADQEVLKELLEQKLPKLAEHLYRCDIDLATVTLNWFLALFFEAVPFQTMLRIWDCFLLEGPKVLFRFALGLLSTHQDTVIQRTDTISVMKVLKAAARLSYDIDGLVKVAFEGMKPFPKRQDLMAKQKCYLSLLKDRLRKKEELKAALTEPIENLKNQMIMEQLSSCPDSSKAVLGFGQQNLAKLAIIDTKSSMATVASLELDCRIVSIVMTDKHFGFVSLISSYLVAVSFDLQTSTCEKQWELKLSDVPLSLVYMENRLFAALANGSLAVIENAAETTPSFLELYYIPIGPAPLTSLAVTDHQLWVAMGSKAIVLSTRTLDCMEHLYVAASVSGGYVSFFDKILAFQNSKEGMWLCTAHSSLVQLWDPQSFTCRLLFDISADHHDRKTNGESEEAETQITVLLAHEKTLWVGTMDGYLFMYDVQQRKTPQLSHGLPSHSSISNSYPTGTRVSPSNSTNRNIYIPPRGEESMTADEEEGNVSPVSPTATFKKFPVAARDSGYDDSSGDGISRPVSTHSPSQSSLSTTNEDPPDSKRFVSQRSKSFSTLKSASAAKIEKKKQLGKTKSRDESNPNGPSNPNPTTAPSSSRARSISGEIRISNRSRRTSNASLGDHIEANEFAPIGRRISASRVIVRPKSSVDLSIERKSSKGTEGGEEGKVPLPSRLANSYSSLQSPVDPYEYDDLFFLYSEAEDSEGRGRKKARSGGLCSAKLHKTDSIWSLNPDGFTWSVEEYILARRKKSSLLAEAAGQVPRRPSTLKLRRKDLEFENVSPTGSLALPEMDGTENGMDGRNSIIASSETASVISVASSAIDPPFSFSLALQMKLKISDKPVKCLTLCKQDDGQDVVLSCAGNFGEEEGILKWTREAKTGLWINDPIVNGAKNMKSGVSSRSSSFLSTF